MSEFTHLHLHTQYSLLDGAIRVKDLYPKVQELGMDAVACTDHGNMYGAVDLYSAARKHGTKMIFGCETYVAASGRTDRTNRRSYHLVLLAKNQVGYKNLSYLNSMGFLEGFYYNPRIDKELLRKHSEGLIGLSACLGGEIAQTLLKRGVKAAEEAALEYKDIFAPGDYYLEMMDNGVDEQNTINDEYRSMGPRLGIPLVATNDCHYVEKKDAKAQEILMSIQSGKTLSDEKRLRHNKDAFYIKSAAEMNKAFHDVPEALENTVRIARSCNVELALDETNYLPDYKVPEGHNINSYFEEVVWKGLDGRFREMTARGDSFDPDKYRERIQHELSVIKNMEFPGYFLIVWDFINWAKKHNIPVGPGRGSGAGSCVAYAMAITDVDPLPFKLLFERFLNPERVSMPDFDIDFCMDRREEVITYVQDKYGRDRVGQIATFHQLKPRGVIRDICRVMEVPYAEADRLAKLVPDPVAGKTPPVMECVEQEPELKKAYESDPRIREILDIAASLEGLNRHAGTHAAGVVISENPLWEYVPCCRGKNGEIVTQFDMGNAERVGLVKFDFLGLKTLTVIDTAVRIINEQREAAGEELLDMRMVPFDDDAVFKLISRGDTTGVFQLESSGFREILKKLKPDCLEDIVAAVALYRPGPLEGGMVDDFIDRKHGRKKVEYPHADLEWVLVDTYGVIVYQEQVMQISQVMAGYSLGRADLLRRAMGKKKVEVMAEEKIGFLKGAKERGYDEANAEAVFDLMAFFAGYGFNRSHSVAYAVISYQTAWLKAHYPHEFMAGLMSCDEDNTDNIVKFIAEARAMGLTVQRPDINESAQKFTVVSGEDDTKVIRFGLGAVKGIGHGAVEAILDARNEEGAFESLYQVTDRVDLSRVNRRVMEALCKSGAFEQLAEKRGHHRAQVFASIEMAIERGQQAQKDRKSGQTSLFGLLAPPSDADGADVGDELYPDVPQWSPKQLLQFEKESLGFYISGHPLDRYANDLSRYATGTTADYVESRKKPGPAAMGGIVSAYRERPTRRGDGKIAFFQLEDHHGQLEVIVFPKTFEKVREALTSEEPLLCTGKVVDEGEGDSHEWRMLLESATPLAEMRVAKTKRVEIRLDGENISLEQIESLRNVLADAEGEVKSIVHIALRGKGVAIIPLAQTYSVPATDELLVQIERLFGDRVATFA